MLRQLILAASRSARTRRLVVGAPVSRAVVQRFVAGGTTVEVVAAGVALLASGRLVSVDYLGEDTTDAGQAAAAVTAYLQLLAQLAEAGLTAQGRTEVSVKLSALGQQQDPARALAHAAQICAAATAAGTTVTLDMEDHTRTDATLAALATLRRDFPATGAVLQAHLRRTEADCRDLATSGSRVRLCKGAYQEPAAVAYQRREEVDRSYVRCLRVLMAGPGYPMVATHDPRLLALAGELAAGRPAGSHEYQMLLGVRPREQERLAAQGETMRVYVPYGDQWYGYLMRRLAERPANVAFLLRAVATRS